MTTILRRLLGCFFILLLFSGYVAAGQGGPSAAGVAWADDQDVNFNWTEISDGTALDTSVNDTFYTVSLPFTFNYYGVDFSTVYVSNNGYLTFHNYSAENFASNDSLQLSQSPDSLIAIFWDDFNTLSGGSAQIYHKTVGTSPYRRFIVEYRNVTLAAGGGALSFQVVLYETLNLIKFQYLTLGGLTDPERGGEATIGLRYTGSSVSDSLVYSVNTASLSNNLAILFYPSDDLTASTPVLDPDTVALGTGGQPFSIRIDNLSLVSATSLQEMGKGDSIRINNPFTNNIFVTGVRVDGQDYFYQNSTTPPTEAGLATWSYSSGAQNLTVLLPPFAAKDSVTINFVENIPTTPGDFNFTADIASRLNPTGAFSSLVPIRVEATTVASYTFIPASDTSFAAGDTITYILKALDQFGNGVINSGSVNLTTIGSATASFVPASPVSFVSDSVLTFKVTDTQMGDFNVRAVNTVNSGVTGQSGLITVNPALPNHFVKLSSETGIEVGTVRLLQVRLEDAFNNVISDSVVTFEMVSGGNGNFVGSDSMPTTNSSGVAEALYTASTSTSFGIDTIRVNIGSVADSIFLPLESGSISHFDLTIQSPMPAAAGDTVSVRVVAKDILNNGVLNSSSVVMSAIGSTTAQFIPSDTYSFIGDSAVTISVRDDIVETFSVRARLVGDLTKQGTSQEITIVPAAPDHFVKLSSETSISAGTTRLLQVRLEDPFNNVIADSVVTFEMVSGGNGNFVGSDSMPTTNSSGVAEALYTASTSTSFGIDTIRVNIGSVADSIFLPLVSGAISHFELTILTAMPAAAGDTVSVRVVAKDLYENPVVSSSQYQATAIGSGTATFIPSAIYTFSSDSADTISVRDTKAGFFNVKAQLSSNPAKQGTSPQIEITPSSLDHLMLRSLAGNKGISLSNVPFNINSSQNIVFYAAGYDQFNNYIDDIDTAFWDDTGTLVHTGTFPTTASSYTFDPAGVGTGRIFISNSGVTPDTTGLITVTGASLSYIQIQSDSADGGPPVGSRTLAAGQTDTLYAVGYDIDNNWLGTVSSDWSVNNTNLGTFQNGFPNISGQKWVVFTAEKIGNGVIDAAAVSNPSIDDQTGLYTVIAGPSDHILIRSASNNSGFVYGDTTITVSADSSIKLVAGFYDVHDNYRGDSVVTWGSLGLIGVPAGPAASIIFSPTIVDTGSIFTMSAIKDDTTGSIMIIPGRLAHIHIQNGPTGSAQEIGSVTLVAGQDTTMYAGGYDNDDNFISLISSNWSLEGDAIGVFSNSNPSTSNVLTGQTVGTAVVRAVEDGGIIQDFTSAIKVLQGDPSVLMKVAVTDSQSGAVGEDLPLEIEVQVYDAFGNAVKDDTVRFIPLLGGLVNGNPSFADVTTDPLGTASVRWTLHGDTTNDRLAATVPNYATTPDTVFYTARVNPGSAASLDTVSAISDTGAVDTDLPAFTIRVIDSLNNPVPGVPISFSIVSRPAGSVGESLSSGSATTDALGQASTQLHLGSKIGTYIVRALAGSTNPPYIDFTGVANQPDVPDTIIIVSGKNQTGIVAQALALPVQFRVTDQFGNIIANEPINFSALQGGGPNPATDTTDAGGLASTIWTLGNSSGTQQLVASLPNFPSVISDTVTATATPGAANSLSLVTMRKLPFDSVAAVPGENITFVVEVRDQFNNLKPNATVRFASEPGYNALFESNQLVSNSNGQVSNVVKTDKTKPETFFRAYITGVDTLPLHIFHILYFSGSLQPNQVTPGDTAFQLQLDNTSPRAVVLDTNNTSFSFGDGFRSFSSALNGATTLAANSTTTLFFDTATIDSNFTNTTYTPELAITGGGVDSALAGNITLPINSLSIFNVRITRITATQQQVARGQTFPITMTVRNNGPLTINVNTSLTTLTFTPTLSALVSFAGGPTQLQPNSTSNLTLNVDVPTNAGLGPYIVDGQFTGSVQGSGVSVFDSNSDVTDTFSVVSNATINVVAQTLTPIKVTNGDTVTFQVRLNNSGDFGVILNPDSTYLSFGTDTILLSQSYSLPAGNSVQVSFGPGPITTPARAAAFTPSIRLYGTENEAEFDDTLSTAPDTVLVQSPPDLQVAFINIVPDTVSQNQGFIQAQVVLQNVGALNATARISSNAAMSLSTIKWPALLADPGIFPIEIAANAFSDTITFSSYLIDINYPTGYDTARVTYTFSDINSGKTYMRSPADYDTVLVLSRAMLSLENNSVNPDTANQGQTGIDLRFTVRNTGQASASIDSSGLSVHFNNAHDLTLNSPVSFPVILAQNDTQRFIYNVQIDSNSGTGWDRYDLAVSHTDVRSGKTYTDINVADLDSIFIKSPGAASTLDIQFVQIPKVNVNQGQTGISAKVRLKNFAMGTVRVDSLFLLPGRGGVNSTLTNPSLPSNIPGGGFLDYSFTISIDSTTSPGPVGINARYVATDLESGFQFSLTGSNLPDTVNVFIPATFVIQKLNLSKEIVSEGQTGIMASGILKNGTSASYSPVKLDSMKLLFNVGGNNIAATRLNPLPQLQGNDSLMVQFALQISDPSTYLGDVVVNLEASGTDLTDLGLVRDTSLVGDTLTIQRKGDIIIDSVRTPVTTASIGQTGIPVAVYFHNPGQAFVDVSSASLFFNGGTAGFFQSFDSVAVDPFTESDTAYFTLQVLGSATPGAYTITSKVSGIEQNTQAAVFDSSSSLIGDVINITAPGQLRILSVSSDFDSVSIGSQGVPVSARIANMGSSTVLVDSLRLTFSKGSYTSVDTILSPSLALSGGSNTTIDLNIGVPGINTPGVATINARVWGRDSLSLASIQDLGADTTDTWRLVTPAQLSISSIAPDSVSNGQNVSFSAQVQNSGQATVRYSNTSTYLNLNGIQVFVNQSGTIYGNSTATLNFDPTTINFPAGNLNGALLIKNYTENGFLKSDSLTPATVAVFDSATVEINALTLSQDTISQNMNLDMQITLANNGANNADAIIDSIAIPTFNYGQTANLRIPAAGSQIFDLSPFVSDDFSGTVGFDIIVYWHDQFIGGQNTVDSSRSVLVLNKASIQVTNIVKPNSVSVGQTGIPVDISLTNTGQVPATIQSINFTKIIGIYTITPPASFENVPAGGTAIYNFTFAVNGNSATGTDTISVNVAGQDSISGNGVQTGSSFSWTIESQSDVQILSAIPAQSIVSRGQSNIPVKVMFENQGGEITQIDTVFLHFSNGDSNYTGIVETPALVLDPGKQDSVEFLVSVNGTAPTGIATINAAAVGRALTSGNTVFIPQANVKGSWTVQQRPQIIVPLLSLSRDTVSTGQSNIALTFRVRNNGGGLPTATAQIDSMNLVIDGTKNDSSQFTFVPQFTTPINLVNNLQLNFNFQLAVRNTALPGVHNFQMTIYYKDINDSSLFNLPPDGGPSDILVVQQRGELVITAIQIVPDSAYVGQNGVGFALTAKNVGEGKVQLNSADLNLHGASNFVKSLQTFGFPFVLQQDDSIDVNYLVDVPGNLNLPPFTDTLIYAGGILAGLDLNSGTPFSPPVRKDSLNFLTVVNPAHVAFDSLVPTGLLDVDTTVSFTAYVTNDGGSNLYLNSNTRLRLVGISNPLDSIVIPINPDSSDMKILSGGSAQLVFQEQQLTQTGDFQAFLEIDGTVNLRPYKQTLTRPDAIINVGGNLLIQQLVINPDQVPPGEDSVMVSIGIQNIGPELLIDSAETYLQFNYTDNGEELAVIEVRVDTLTKISQGQSVSLEWLFNVPADARTGEVEVAAFLSFNGGTVLRGRSNTFDIVSGVNIDYVLNTLFPDSTVPGQSVSFTASFINSGNTRLNLNPDSSFMQFSDGTRMYQALVNGNLSIQGTQDSIPDTSVISFTTNQIDPAFIADIYPVTFRMAGTLPNLEPYAGYEATFPNQVTVLEEANVQVDSIDILLSNILAGQDNVEIRYYLSNSGNSPANLSSMSSVFRDSSGIDISGFWTQVFQSPSLPFAIDKQSTALITRRFNVSPSIAAGAVRAFSTGQFNDTRKPADIKTFDNPAIYDSVNVISPSSIYIDSLVLANVPNVANGTVNYGQAYDVKLVLQNSGGDALQDVVVELRRNSVPIDTVTLAGPVAAGDTLQNIYHFTAGAVSQSLEYWAVLIEAVSVTSGTPVPIGQPIDNKETVTIQDSSVLTLTAFASDSTLSQNQEFRVDFQIGRAGQSPIGAGEVQILLPPNYSLAPATPDSVLPISANVLSGFWRVTANDTTTGIEDIITVNYAVRPLDQNTNNPVAVTNTEATIPVSTRNFGSVEVANISIIEPPGAVDNILSTGQIFRLKAKFGFIGAVSPNNRTAELVLPAGAGFLSDSTIKSLNNADSAIWEIRAPDVVSQASEKTGGQNAESGSSTRSINGIIEALQGEFFNLEVVIHAFEENTGTPISGTLDHQVEVQGKAQLEIHADIVAPGGATDGIISSDQFFDVRVWVGNTGEAQTTGTNNVVMRVTPGFDIQSSPADTILLVIPTGEAFADTVRITAPDTASASQQNLPVFIKNAALDENSNQPAFVSSRQQVVQVNVVNKASLRVENLEVVSPPGATDKIVSYGQTFTFQAVVINAGQAGVLTSPQGTVEIQLGDLLQIAGGTPTVPFNINEPVQWQVKVDSNAAVAMLSKKIRDLKIQSSNLLESGTSTMTGTTEGSSFGTIVSDARAVEQKETRDAPQMSLLKQMDNETLASVNDQLSDLYEQLTELIDTSTITVSIETVPFDENTLDSAFVELRSQDTDIYIEEEPFIDVASWQIRQRWSTDQIDTVEVMVSKPDQVIINSANLTLPAGFNNLGMQVQGNLYRWRVRTPADVPQQTNYQVMLDFVGIDQNSMDTVTVNRDTTITVERQAQLKMRSGTYSLRVSKNQKFSVTATILNEGEAGIAGTGILEILPGQMLLDVGEVTEKSFTAVPTTLQWNLAAPDTNVNTLVTIRVKQRPLDINKSTPVLLNSDSSQVVIDVNMIPKRLFLSKLDTISPGRNYEQNSRNIGMLGLGFENPETLKEDTIYVDSLSLSVKDPSNDELIDDVQNLISRIRVVSYNYYSSLSKSNGGPDEFANILIGGTQNPISVHFSELDTITSGELDSLVILVDIAPGAPNRNFTIGIEDISAFQLVEERRFAVDVTDAVGNPLSTITSLFRSSSVSVVSSDAEKIFGNYPNPFGLDDGDGTTFIFFMENPGTADLRIYTLLGELVWSETRELPSQGLYDGKDTFHWKGKNNAGRVVLNGVYIAIMKVEYAGGGTKTFKTKVAFIK